MSERWRRGARALRELEGVLGHGFAASYPYVKFLPLVLRPLRLTWRCVPGCDSESPRLIVIPAYGRDPVARAGWIRLAVLSAWALLHCRGIDAFRVVVLIGDHVAAHGELEAAAEALFGDDVGPELEELERRGVRCHHVARPLSTGSLYAHLALTGIRSVMRVDADSGFLPSALSAPCFLFDRPLGESGLNFRHTRKGGLDQLFDATAGRMRVWPPAYRRAPEAFLAAASRVVEASLGIGIAPAELAARMASRPWPSEGLSYIAAEHVPAFVALQRALRSAGMIPGSDEEIVKLLLAAVHEWTFEVARVPVLEYDEYGPASPGDSVVNFRNGRQLAARVGALLADERAGATQLSYLRAFAEDVRTRAALAPPP